MNWLDSVSLNLINKNLDGLWTRQQAISDNIANYETPGYKVKQISFEDALRKQFKKTATENDLINNIKNTQPELTVLDNETMRLDDNGVDLEKENIELVRTQLNYYYSLQQISDQFSRLRTVIKGGQ
ncbi:MAG: flagellar basal body rod protein FlgB [Clostridia bacterium]|nr:flagellar basal body rod protein FlgB [Clostridia bacterium]MDD4571264.1 flagellar basal body rod protein FlgB [Clostridia bacterium]